MSHWSELAILIVSALSGMLGAMVGLGGGVFMVPIFSAFLNVPIKTAIAASALAVIVNSLTGSIVYLRHQMVNLRVALLLLIPTALGAIAGAFLVAVAPANALRLVFAVVLYGMITLLSSKQATRDPIVQGPDRLSLRGAFFDPALGAPVRYIPQHVALGSAFSAVTGLVAGLLGVGGGFMKVPLMNTLMRIPVKAVVATSAYSNGVTVTGSALLFYANDLLVPQVVIPAVFGVFIGSELGARLGRRVRGLWLRRLLIVILLYLATTLLLQALGIPVPGTR
jgi:uncharacterized membrane protein YfcA